MAPNQGMKFIGLMGLILFGPTQNLSQVLAQQSSTHTTDFAITVTAVNGQPFGVGVVKLVPEPWRPNLWKPPESAALQLLGEVALYPVVERTGSGTNKVHALDEYNVYFLYDPARASKITVLGIEIELEPTNDEPAHRDALAHWWKRYAADADSSARRIPYPAEIEQYLTQTLARRLHLPVPQAAWSKSSFNGDMDTMIGGMTGTRAVRMAMQKDSLLGTSRDESATFDLPHAVSPPAVEIPEPDPDVEIETIAMAVPPEYFYARFTRYEDLAWFGDIVNAWGTELSGLATESGFQYDVRQQMQDQLNVYQSELAQQLSAAIVNDYAIIGSDTFVREGAGIGILFHANSNDLLKGFLDNQRTQRAAKGDGVTLTDVPFEGLEQSASLLASADNRVRSFYVSSGDFHLITTSRTIARRFLETGLDRTKSLGATREFRYARTVTPVSRNDTAFIYLSDMFFRTFVDPAFRVEMTRRAASESEVELVYLAILSAKAEHRPHATIDELISGGFLPPNFQARADGSHLTLKNGDVIDSVRGARGSFLPVPDVEVGKVTKSEVDGYAEFSKVYGQIWTWMDPATLAIQRHILDGQERLTLDLHVYPYPRREFLWLDFLRVKQSKQRMAPIPEAILWAEANVMDMKPAFAGIVDIDVPIFVENGKIDSSIFDFEREPWFIGETPNNGFTSRIIAPQNNRLRKGGIVQLSESPNQNIFDMQFGYADDDFTVYSPQRFALEKLAGNLKLIDADRSAEARIHVGDLATAKVRRFLDAEYWTSAIQLAESHEELLNRMVTQFHVPAAEASSTLEQLRQAHLVCPLGGDYQADKQGVIRRTSKVELREFEHPLLKRIRSAEFELTTEGTTLTSHAEVLLDVP